MNTRNVVLIVVVCVLFLLPCLLGVLGMLFWLMMRSELDRLAAMAL
jgi:hypothetical protein